MVRKRKRVEDEDVEKENKRKIAQERLDLKFVLSHPQGRRVIWKLIEECKVFHSVWDQSLAVINWNEGKRHVGLMLMDWLNEVDPAILYHIAMENKEYGDQ